MQAAYHRFRTLHCSMKAIHSGRSTRLGLLGVLACAVAALPGTGIASASISSHQGSALTPEQAAAVALPGASFRDRVLPLRPRGTARAAASVNPKDRTGTTRGGLLTGVAGSTRATLRVYISNRFPTWDRSLNQLWANRFAAMLHGTEISTLKVYISPLTEIRSSWVCGSWADSCYDPNDGTMYLTGERPEDGADINQIAMHEYAHHIATNRTNSPWDASMWGPKQWATAQGVCSYAAQRQMWPTDPVNHYEDHPGEIWAETYRLVTSAHQGLPPDPWEIISSRWNPTGKSAILSAARLDVVQPWRAKRTITLAGSLTSSGPQSATNTVSLPLDGSVSASLTVKGSLKARVELTSPGGARFGSTSGTSATATSCGTRSTNATVRRTSGTGTWSLRLLVP